MRFRIGDRDFGGLDSENCNMVIRDLENAESWVLGLESGDWRTDT